MKRMICVLLVSMFALVSCATTTVHPNGTTETTSIDMDAIATALNTALQAYSLIADQMLETMRAKTEAEIANNLIALQSAQARLELLQAQANAFIQTIGALQELRNNNK